VFLRLAYLTITNLFSAVRLLSVGDRDKDAEILALRHQITDPRPQIELHAILRRCLPGANQASARPA
jgi:hypothetical protein